MGRRRLRRRLLGSLLLVVVTGLCSVGSASAATGPVLSGTVTDQVDLPGALSVAIAGNYAYTTAYQAGRLTAVDISNPKNPFVAGATPMTKSLQNSTNVTISGHYAYVVSKNRNGPQGSGSNDDGSGNSLTIVDITNPAVPTVVGSVHDSVSLFGGYGIAVSGQYAYVAAQGCVAGKLCPNPAVGNSFVVVDVSNPANPTIAATLSNNALPAPYAGSNALDHATSVAISGDGDYAYVTGSYANRLTVIDIAHPLSPTIVASLQDNTQLNFDVDVSIQGTYAYVANQSTYKGLAVVDISNPTNPQIVGVANSAWLNGAYRVRVHKNFAYVAASYAIAATTVDISNPAAPRVAAGVYDPTHFNSTTGLEVDPTNRYLVVNSPNLSTDGSTSYPPYPGQTGGPPFSHGTISVLTLDPKPIAVGISSSSKPANPTNQTSANFSFSTSDSVASVLCQIDGAPLSLCTTPSSQQYSSLSPGSHTFVVQATDAAGNTATASYTWVVSGATSSPVNTVPPTVSGSTVQGSQLSATTGTWTGSPAPTFGYQWEDCDTGGGSCSSILGATSSSYTLTSNDLGSTVRVVVTGTNTAGQSSAQSSATAVVTGSSGSSPPVNTTPPSISGSAVEAQTLMASPGNWTGSPAPTFGYQWQRCDQSGSNCVGITGANSGTYAVVSADVGSTLRVVVTGTNSSGSVPANSTATTVVTSAPGTLTPVLDNFNRPDNTGPPGPNWTHIPSLSSSSSNDLFITGQQVTGSSGYNADYFNAQQFGPNAEAYVTVATKPTTVLDVVELGLRYQNPALATAAGYQAWYINEGSSPDHYKILLRTNGQANTTALASATGPSLNQGDKLLFRAVGTTLELWRGSGATWTRILTATDSTIQSAGYLALVARDGTVRLDDFGGGTLP